MKRNAIFAISLLALSGGLLLSASKAYADSVDLTLLNPYQDAIPGQTLNFDATVSAPTTNSSVEYLNGATFSTPLILDDTSYFVNFPLSLNPGDSYTGPLFTIQVPDDTPEFNVYPSSFSITGGPEISSSDILSTVTFDVNVTPEPPALVLLATGVLSLGVGAFLRRETLSQVAG